MALSGSFKELQQLRILLHALSGALPQTDKRQQKNHEKTHTCIAELTESVESLREEVARWRARMDQRLDRIERTLEDSSPPESELPAAPPSSPAPAPAPPTEPPSELNVIQTEPANGQSPEGMSAVLMNAFQAELGGPKEPRPEDYQSLDVVFDMALGDAQKNPSEAVERFSTWLTIFRELTVKNPSLDRTPQDFAREVAARRLEN